MKARFHRAPVIDIATDLTAVEIWLSTLY